MQMSREDEDEKRINELCAMGIHTPIELVKHYIPDATDEFADWLLWEKTSFPIGGIVDCECGIKEYVQALQPKEDVK